jgi:hypothetical protein
MIGAGLAQNGCKIIGGPVPFIFSLAKALRRKGRESIQEELGTLIFTIPQ